MAVKNEEGISTKDQMDIDEYNKWCKELNVSRQYYKKTQYYQTDYRLKRTELESSSFIALLSRIYKRIVM